MKKTASDIVQGAQNKRLSSKQDCRTPGTPTFNFQQSVKMVFFGQIPILQGILEGRRRRCDQRKKWLPNVNDWTDRPVPDLLTIAHNRQEWRPQ